MAHLPQLQLRANCEQLHLQSDMQAGKSRDHTNMGPYAELLMHQTRRRVSGVPLPYPPQSGEWAASWMGPTSPAPKTQLAAHWIHSRAGHLRRIVVKDCAPAKAPRQCHRQRATTGTGGMLHACSMTPRPRAPSLAACLHRLVVQRHVGCGQDAGAILRLAAGEQGHHLYAQG